jgi:hypothetical protein
MNDFEKQKKLRINVNASVKRKKLMLRHKKKKMNGGRKNNNHALQEVKDFQVTPLNY